MLKTRLWGAAALIVTLAMALPAIAQDDTGSEDDARAQFDAGRAAYEEGRFEDAARAFGRAYLLSPRYQLLYNIGQAELRAGHDDRALAAFEGFLRQAPGADPRHSEVQERVNVMRGMGIQPAAEVTAEQPAEPAPAEDSPPEVKASEPPPSEPPASTRSVGPWITIAAGGAGAVAGAVLMGLGVAKAKEVTDAPAGSRWSEVEDTGNTAKLLWGVGIGAAAVGLAAVGAGAAWAIAGSREDERRTGTALSLRVGMGSVAFEGAF
jgi:tetratricopeptide (TPR) repeat protein